MATVEEFTSKGLSPQTHAYNEPGLSAIEFLLAVMNSAHLPMATRIQAASAALPFTNPYPRPKNSVAPQCTIVIGGLGDYDHGSSSKVPASGSTGIDSQIQIGAQPSMACDGEALPPQNLTTIPDPSPLPDYSTPPPPAELQEIKAAINKLRPDLAHLPVPEFHLCPCGHWIIGEYDCCRHELSKLN